MNIVPSILAQDLEEFNLQIRKILPLGNRIQIDFADGKLVEGQTLQLEEMLYCLANIASSLTEKVFDFHLMVIEPQKYLDELASQKIVKININLVLIHQKVFLQGLQTAFKTGIVLNPEDEVSPNIDSNQKAIQIMTVIPGRQGNAFASENLEKIGQLRRSNFQGEIILDGGINNSTLEAVITEENLPDTVTVGSYLTRSTNPKINLEILQSLAIRTKHS